MQRHRIQWRPWPLARRISLLALLLTLGLGLGLGLDPASPALAVEEATPAESRPGCAVKPGFICLD